MLGFRVQGSPHHWSCNHPLEIRGLGFRGELIRALTKFYGFCEGAVLTAGAGGVYTLHSALDELHGADRTEEEDGGHL